MENKNSGPRKKILVVDDDPAILQLTEYNLNKRGYEVVRATNGEAGLAKAEEMPDAILLDVKMPGMPGHEVARRLKANDRTKGIPILMLTGEGQPDSVEQAFEAGAADYIVKPFAPAVLIEKIARVMQ